MAIPVGTAVGYLDLDYSKFSKKLDTAISEANGLSMKFSDTLGSGLTTVGNKIAGLGTALTTGITVPLGLATGSAIKFGAEFDKGMSNVKAVSGATTEEFNEMRDAAIDWGEKTVYTATEASDALYYMGLAGWDANDSVAALGPVLNLAAAGNLDLARTSDIVTDAMTAMKLEAGEYTDGVENTIHFTNALAAAMSNSNTDVDQMGEAFKYVAPLAGAAGMEINDLSLALGMMANVGVKGTQAGTGLRQALKSVISPTQEAKAVMDEYGVSLFDAEGNAKSMRQFMDELRGTFGDLAVDVYDANGELKTAEQIMEEYGHSLPTSQQEKLNAIVEIFGTRALPGVLGIIEQSDEKYNKLASAIENSDKAFVKHGEDLMTYQEAVEKYGEELVNTSSEFEVLGASAGMAEIQMDNLQGDWIRFTSALGTSRIEITDLVNGALRKFVQRLTDLVKWFNDLGDEQQKHILKIVAIIAAIGPLLLVFGKIISGIGRTITAISTISTAIQKLNIGFGLLNVKLRNLAEGFKLARAGFSGFAASASPVGAALGSITAPMVLIAVAIAAVIAAFVHLMKTNEDFRNKMIEIWDGIKAKFEESGQKILDTINKLGFDFESLGEAIKAAFDWFSTRLVPLFTAVFQTIADVIGGLVDIFTGIFEIIGGIIIGFRDGDWSTFVQGILDFTSGISEIFTAPFKFIFNFITELLTQFGTSWNEVWQGIVDFFTGIGQGIIDTVTNIVTAFTAFKEGITNAFTEFNTNLWDGILNFLINLGLQVIQAANNISASIHAFKEDIKQKVTDLVTVVLTTIANFVVNVITKYNEMKSSILDVFNTTKSNVINTVKELATKILDTFDSLKSKVINKVTEIKNGIINVFNGIKDSFTQIGKNIVEGIWNGISSGWSWLQNKVADLAKNLLETAKNALDIHSPSGVFEREVGYWIPLGTAEGVEDSMPKAIDKIQNAFDKGLSQISADVDVGNPLFDMVGVIKTVLNETTIWFESIEERLYAIVDNMKTDLMNLIELGQVTINSDGTLSGLVYDRPANSIKQTDNGSEKSSGTVINNYNNTFNSPKAIDEIEAARLFKETQRDLAEGF